jgi:hypothetical protein
MWLTAPSTAFCKATALLAPVAMTTTSLAWFPWCQLITPDRETIERKKKKKGKNANRNGV